MPTNTNLNAINLEKRQTIFNIISVIFSTFLLTSGLGLFLNKSTLGNNKNNTYGLNKYGG